MTKKKKETVKTTLNFIITDMKSGELSVSTRRYDWKMIFAPNTRHYQLLQHYIANNTAEELDVMLEWEYIVSTTLLTDTNLKDVVLNYFKSTLETKLIEVTEAEEVENLKIVKEDYEATSTDE